MLAGCVVACVKCNIVLYVSLWKVYAGVAAFGCLSRCCFIGYCFVFLQLLCFLVIMNAHFAVLQIVNL